MLAIIVGTHGAFATELVKSCEMICGKMENVKAVTLVPGEGADDLKQKYETALKELDTSDGAIFLNDLFGGSPYNAACRIAMENESYGVVTGVNLPMLIELAALRSAGGSIHEFMETAAQAGRSGTRVFHVSKVEEDEEDL